MSQFSIEGNRVVFANGRTVEFELPVAEAVDFGEALVVRLDVPPKRLFNENVFGVNEKLGLLWQIAPRRYVYEDSPYTSIRQEGPNAILANWDGLDLIAVPRTGEVIDRRESR